MMKSLLSTRLIVAILCFFSASAAFGQWKEVKLPSNPIFADFVDGGSVTYAFDYQNGNAIAYSVDGLNWKIVDLYSADLEKLLAASGDTVVGQSYGFGEFLLWTSTNRGQTVTEISLPEGIIRNKCFFSNGRLIALFEDLKVRYSDNLGVSWQVSQLSTGVGIINTHFHQAFGKLWMSGTASLQTSNDNGATWAPSAPIPGATYVYSIDGNDNMLIATTQLSILNGKHIFQSIDQGATWTQNVHFPTNATDIFADSDNLYCTSDSLSYVSHDNGLSWLNTAKTIQKVANGMLYDQQYCSLDGGTTWEVGFFGLPNHMTNNCSTTLNHLTISSYTPEFRFWGNDSGSAHKWEHRRDTPFTYYPTLYENLLFGEGPGATILYVSGDDGKNWQPTQINHLQYEVLTVFQGTVFLIDLFTDDLYFTHNFGQTIEPLIISGANAGLAFFDHILQTNSHLYLLKASGGHFRSSAANPVDFESVNIPAPAGIPVVKYFSVGDYLFGVTPGQEKLHRWNGNNWQACIFPNGPNINSFATVSSYVQSGDDYYMTVEGNPASFIFQSNDAGLSWIDISGQFPIVSRFITCTKTKSHFYVRCSADNILHSHIYAKPISSNTPLQASGLTFKDLNENGIHDNSEPAAKQMFLRSKPSGYFAVSDTNGAFQLPYQFDQAQQIEVLLNNPYQSITTSSQSIDTTAGHIHKIGIAEQPNVRDLCIDITADQVFRPGFMVDVYITVRNIGTIAADGTVKLIIPSETEYISAWPSPPSSIVGDTLYFQVPLLQIGSSITMSLKLKTKVNTPLGVNLSTVAEVSPVDTDQNPTNNTYTIRETVVGSYDPNDKAVTPANIHPDMVADGIDLYYTVRFQNTGNFPASFVRILDTLDQNLDVTTLEVVSASHPYTYTVRGRDVLDVFFDNINLPDSTSNEPESHGFVKFKIKADTTLSLGQRIKNTAFIYFDFNAPVVTNTVTTEVKIVRTHEPMTSITFDVSPNPGSGAFRFVLAQPILQPVTVQVLDALGRVCVTRQYDQLSNAVLLPDWHGAAGVYHVQVTAQNGDVAVRKIVLKD